MEINRQQFIIRIIYFFYLAGLSCLMPYLPVFMRHKGLSESQIGLIRGSEAIALMLFTPLWGCIASKTPQHKLVLLVTIIASTLFAFSILFTPPTLSPVACFPYSSCKLTNQTTNPYSSLLHESDAPTDSTNHQLIFCNLSSSGNFTSNLIHSCTTLPPQLCQVKTHATNSQQSSDLCVWSPVNWDVSCQKIIFVEDLLRESNCHICCLGGDPVSSPLCCNSTYDFTARATGGTEPTYTHTNGLWNSWETFLLIAVLLLFSSFFRCAIFPVLDATCMELLEGSRIRYNKERLWGSVGWGGFALLSGVILDITRFGDFSSCFYLSLSLTAIAAFAIGCLRFPVQSLSQQPHNLQQILCKAEILVFFSLALVMGFSFGILGTYLLLYLEDLHGPYSLMGLTMTLSCLAEVPFIYISGTLAQYVGHHGIIMIALLCYTVRFCAYSLISISWLVIPFELLHGITYGASWAGCSFYANHIAPPGLANTLLKIFTALYMGLGKGLGAFAGGFIYQYLGAKMLFRLAALVSIMCAILYSTSVIIIRRRGVDYKQFNDDVDEPSGSVQMEPNPRHHPTDGDTPCTRDQPPTSIQGRKRCMRLALQDIYQPEDPLSFSMDPDQECLLSSEVTPPDLRVMRLEFQPPPDWLKGRSYGGAGGSDGKKDLEVRLDAIGSEGDSGGPRRKGTHTSLV